MAVRGNTTPPPAPRPPPPMPSMAGQACELGWAACTWSWGSEARLDACAVHACNRGASQVAVAPTALLEDRCVASMLTCA
eukprot:315554-Chlamydomonas_euryale.AAC.6